MKTMNCLLAIALIFTLGSCSNETPTENEELAAVEYRGRIDQEDPQEAQKVFELDLQQYYVLGQLAKLDFQKKELEQKIDDGRKDLLPMLELTMEDFSNYENRLEDLKDAMCHILGAKADQLKEHVERGDEEAKKELEEMDEILKKCGIKVSYYEYISNGYNFASLPKTTTVGGCSDPGSDFYEACDIPMDGGKKIIKTDESVKFINLLTTDGEKVTQAEFIGKGKDGLYEYSLDVPLVNSKLFLSVSKKNIEYSVPIKVSNEL